MDENMATRYDVDATELIERMAKDFEKVPAIQPPSWAPFVKTGASKELPPARKDWWQVRAASVLRKVSMKGPIGVSKLRVQYGGKKNRGSRTEVFKKGSGAITRRLLQQLEKAGFIKQTKIGVHFGRIITKEGEEFMDKAASAIWKEHGGKKQLVTPVAKPAPKVEAKAAPAPKPAEKPAPKAEAKAPEVKEAN